VNGVARTFTEVIPDGYDASVAHPILMRFGGLGSTGASAVGGIGLKVPAIIVGPDANPPGGYWNTTGDLALVDAIVDTLSKELCIDTTRNFATGYSNGGFMADAVGCMRSAQFKGIAVMEGGTGGTQCGQVGAFLMHNADDMTVPLSYGTSLRDKWLATNGCTMTSHAVTPDPCVAYDGCSAGHPVVWCEPATGGHKPSYAVSLGIGPFFDAL
jgi:poly(3-hydroxybutyrate) depolymerase